MKSKNISLRAAWKSVFVALVTVSAVASAQAFVLGPTSPGKWGSPIMGTPGGVVTWSYMPTGAGVGGEGHGGFIDVGTFLPVGYDAAITAAFGAWSAVANISFLKVIDDGLPFNSGASGHIRIGGHAFDGAGGTLAHGYYPPLNGATAAGDIHFDIAEAWKIGFGGPGFDVFQVMAHEIGHAIGLAHTAVPGSLMNPFYTEAFSGPQADDIAGAQHIYGAPVSTPDSGSTLLLLGAMLVGFVALRRLQA